MVVLRIGRRDSGTDRFHSLYRSRLGSTGWRWPALPRPYRRTTSPCDRRRTAGICTNSSRAASSDSRRPSRFRPTTNRLCRSCFSLIHSDTSCPHGHVASECSDFYTRAPLFDRLHRFISPLHLAAFTRSLPHFPFRTAPRPGGKSLFPAIVNSIPAVRHVPSPTAIDVWPTPDRYGRPASTICATVVRQT
jgi:hypothetical protein